MSQIGTIDTTAATLACRSAIEGQSAGRSRRAGVTRQRAFPVRRSRLSHAATAAKVHMTTDMIESEEFQDDSEISAGGWELKKLNPKHLQICALLAQGLKNIEVAAAVGVTPQYIPMLMQQPLIRAEVQRISSIASTRLEAMFEKSVDVLGDVLRDGNNTEKLKAIRVHGELTKRIGRPDPMAKTNEVDSDRLVQLSERLVGLLEGSRKNVLEGDFRKEQAEDI